MSIVKKDIEKRERSIKIRVTDSELARLNERKGRAELARWLRELGLTSGGKTKKITHELPPEVVRILAGIGGNLNQISRNVNMAAKAGRLDLAQGLLPLMSQLRSTEKALDLVREFLSKDA
jgi:hypothetical protein